MPLALSVRYDEAAFFQSTRLLRVEEPHPRNDMSAENKTRHEFLAGFLLLLLKLHQQLSVLIGIGRVHQQDLVDNDQRFLFAAYIQE